MEVSAARTADSSQVAPTNLPPHNKPRQVSNAVPSIAARFMTTSAPQPDHFFGPHGQIDRKGGRQDQRPGRSVDRSRMEQLVHRGQIGQD